MDLKIGPDKASDIEIDAVAAVVIDSGPATVVDGERLVLGGFHRATERRHLLLPGLHALQQARGHISEGGLNHLCETLGVPPAEAYSVATFYDLFSTETQPDTVVRVCDDVGCRLFEETAVEAALAEKGVAAAHRKPSPCLGLCDHGAAALVQQTGFKPEAIRASASAAAPVVEAHVPGGARLLRRAVNGDTLTLEDYLDSGGYAALRVAVERGADDVIAAVSDSGLRGRGGAAFPTGFKWRAVADETSPIKHVVANADESEPGTFKDRVLMEHDPFGLIEALIVAGFATGSTHGWIYVRGEYPLAIERLENAITETRTAGLLGTNVLDAGFDFDIDLRVGAGAYICGEETALFNSIEGYRGEPRQKPPYPTTNGLFDQPTSINNVETLVNVLEILNEGVDAYRSVGTESSPGTRLFCLSGHIARPGVYELPMGITLRDIFDVAGGVADGRGLKAVLLGGAAGVFVDEESFDVPLTFEDTREAGITLGSGVVMVLDDTVDVRDTITRIAEFFSHESCGQCVPCRIGTQRQYELIGRANQNETLEADLFEDLASVMKDASICGLGHTASSAIRSAIDLGLLT